MKNSIRPAFSLIELLIVIAIVAVLVSLLLPALAKTKEMALRTTCASKMRQIALGTTVYRMDYRDWMPAINNWGNGGIQWGLLVSANYRPSLEEYWPAGVRACPSLVIQPTDNFKWMYSAPMLGNEYAAWGYMADRVPSSLNYAYVRITSGAACYTNGLGNIVRFNLPVNPGYDPTKAFPMFADLIGVTSGLYRTMPHSASTPNPSVPSSDFIMDSAGGNTIWEDAHLEWHEWPRTAWNYPGNRPELDTPNTRVHQYPHFAAAGAGYFPGDTWTSAGNYGLQYYFWLKVDDGIIRP